MKITYRGINIIIQGKDPSQEFYSDESACDFLNYFIQSIYRYADTMDKEKKSILARVYRRDASDLFDQIALTGYYGEEEQARAQEKQKGGKSR